ncbi:hypothetical protein BASA83_007302 [Batrachochytrium salamandrivorans]|nr:hypothetical protein BASA83_007302 [Batrachochytrium salamandrivorans]
MFYATLLVDRVCNVRYISDLIINIAKVLAIPIVTVNSSVSARFSDVNSDITEYGSASTGLGSSRNSNHAHTTSAPISTPGSRQTQTKPALGAMWMQVPFYRLYFTISSNDGRAELYRVYDAPSSEDGKSDPDSRHGKFNVHGVDSQLRVVENIVELLDGPDKSKLANDVNYWYPQTMYLAVRNFKDSVTIMHGYWIIYEFL